MQIIWKKNWLLNSPSVNLSQAASTSSVGLPTYLTGSSGTFSFLLSSKSGDPVNITCSTEIKWRADAVLILHYASANCHLHICSLRLIPAKIFWSTLPRSVENPVSKVSFTGELEGQLGLVRMTKRKRARHVDMSVVMIHGTLDPTHRWLSRSSRVWAFSRWFTWERGFVPHILRRTFIFRSQVLRRGWDEVDVSDKVWERKKKVERGFLDELVGLGISKCGAKSPNHSNLSLSIDFDGF